MELTYTEQEHMLRKWLSAIGLAKLDWLSRDSVTSPNWCDSSTWPVGPSDSTWKVTAQGLAYPGQTDPPDNRIVVVPRAYIRFMAAVIHEGGDMVVSYSSGETELGQTVYKARKDFTKRSKKKKIEPASDANAGQTGDEWDITLDFLADGKPVILVPSAMSSVENGLPDSMTCKIADDQPYKNAEGTNGGFAYVRYPGVQIYSSELG